MVENAGGRLTSGKEMIRTGLGDLVGDFSGLRRTSWSPEGFLGIMVTPEGGVWLPALEGEASVSLESEATTP